MKSHHFESSHILVAIIILYYFYLWKTWLSNYLIASYTSNFTLQIYYQNSILETRQKRKKKNVSHSPVPKAGTVKKLHLNNYH